MILVLVFFRRCVSCGICCVWLTSHERVWRLLRGIGQPQGTSPVDCFVFQGQTPRALWFGDCWPGGFCTSSGGDEKSCRWAMEHLVDIPRANLQEPFDMMRSSAIRTRNTKKRPAVPTENQMPRGELPSCCIIRVSYRYIEESKSGFAPWGRSWSYILTFSNEAVMGWFPWKSAASTKMLVGLMKLKTSKQLALVVLGNDWMTCVISLQAYLEFTSWGDWGLGRKGPTGLPTRF